MNRRDLFKLTAAAAPAALPGQQKPASPAPASPQAAWKPLLFDAHQNDTVIVLSELMIPATDTPGAKAAKVNVWMDKLLNDGPVEQRNAFLEGLNWLDGYCLRQHRKPFKELTEGQQTAILTTLDTTTDEALAPGRRFFRQAKALTSRIYYATEIGTKELNKGGRVPSTFGCTHNGQHAG